MEGPRDEMEGGWPLQYSEVGITGHIIPSLQMKNQGLGKSCQRSPSKLIRGAGLVQGALQSSSHTSNPILP